MDETIHFLMRHDESVLFRDIVLYCSCPNEITSARTALLLKKNGIARVRPLGRWAGRLARATLSPGSPFASRGRQLRNSPTHPASCNGLTLLCTMRPGGGPHPAPQRVSKGRTRMDRRNLLLLATVLTWSPSEFVAGASAEPGAPAGAPAGMALVPAGPFIYGPEEAEQKLSLPAFFIDLYEVTNEAYAKVRPHQYPDHQATHPVISVSWNDAKRYCEAGGKRLPTEQEWEKAARGTDGRRYPWGDTFDPTKANTGHRFSGPTPVDKFPEGRSPYGVYDMTGNVWEWTSSEQGGGKVVRGGLWFDTVIGAKATYRNSFPPGTQLEYIGFRCAKDAPR